MARKAIEGKPTGETILPTAMEDVMRDSMLPYAEHVILERALPRVEDGLKPVQRRILYTMIELSNTPDKPHRKCARIVGDCLGKYHPHGDTSVYDAMVRMAQPFVLRGMLVDGHGNFGSIDGDSAAAMRYTEARMTPLAMEMLRDIEKDTVSFHLNFDDTLKEPDVLPARFPNLLVNGASGIAVGLATNIPPHNLGEAVDAAIALIDTPKLTTEELMRFLPGPDFPTGGQLIETEELKRAYETGRGKLLVRAKVHVEEGTAGRKLLVITEMPYQVSKAAMLEKILKLSEEKRVLLGGIHDIRDESDRTGLRAVIELKRDADPMLTLAALYKYSDLQVTFGVNIVTIAEGKPMQMGLKDVLSHFIRHQRDVVTRRTQYELDQALARMHILEGLIIAVDNLDEVLRLIRASKNGKEAKAALMPRFGLTDIQAQAILDLRLQRLTGLEILELRAEYAKLQKEIDRLMGILKSEKKLMALIKAELAEVRARFADPRRTEILQETESSLPEPTAQAEAEEAIVFLTRAGLLRRMGPRHFEKAAFEEEKDSPRLLFRTFTDETLYLFTTHGNCYPLAVGSLPEANRPKDRGTTLSGLLAGLEMGEEPVRILCLKPGALETMGDLLFITRGGMLKRTKAAEYQVRKAKFQALGLKGEDRLFDVLPLEAGRTLMLLSFGGMAIHVGLEDVSAMGRIAAGVKGMTLDKGDAIVYSGLVTEGEGEMLIFSERGYGKKALLIDFEKQGRAGKGLKCFTFNKNGANGTRVASALYVRAPYDFFILQQGGMRTRMSTEEIQIEPRAGKGRAFVMALMEDVVTELVPVDA